MRAFVAVELDDACRAALRGALARLRDVARGVRWVGPESLHLTLKFIGELAEADLPRAVASLEAAAASARPFTMHVCGLSGFPPRGTPRVIHVEVREASGVLRGVQAEVEEGLARDLGVAKEKRPFVPHLTLGRVRDRRRCPGVAEISAAVADQDFGEVEVDSVVLMKSDLRPTGAVYTPLHRFPLGRC